VIVLRGLFMWCARHGAQRLTGTAYEAAARGKKATRFEAQYLHGTCGSRCGGHKREGRASYPGRSVLLPCATADESLREGNTEVSRRHSSWFNPPSKARTWRQRQFRFLFVLSRCPERGPEAGGSGWNPRDKAGLLEDGRHSERYAGDDGNRRGTGQYARWCGRGNSARPSPIRSLT
jgi:hypothetical protein